MGCMQMIQMGLITHKHKIKLCQEICGRFRTLIPFDGVQIE